MDRMDASRKGLALLLVPVLLISSLGTTALAEESGWKMTAPKYKVGDYWEYEVKKGSVTFMEKLEVDTVSDVIEITISGQFQNGTNTVTIEGEIKVESPDLSEKERVVVITDSLRTETKNEYNPPLKLYKWPMYNDDSWTSDTSLKVIEDRDGHTTTDTFSPSFKFEVEGAEKEQFQGNEIIVVEIRMSWSDGHRTIWYSPDIGNVYKEEDPSGETRQLKTFKCNDPGDIKEEDGGGGFDLMAMGYMCLALPVIIGVILGAVVGTIIGLYTGYSSKIPRSKARAGGRSGPKFCPLHGTRTEKRGGTRYCHECGGYPKTKFTFCPQHGVRLKMKNGVPTCFECGGGVKW